MSLWRLGTFAVGTVALLYGADVEQIADWDRDVTWLMCIATYALEPLFASSVRIVWLPNQPLRHRAISALFAFLIGDFVVSTTYSMYWAYMNPPILGPSYWNNYPASWALFICCWGVWSVIPDVLNWWRKP